jgi:drug/metabolite transporter (DMT)-like permease
LAIAHKLVSGRIINIGVFYALAAAFGLGAITTQAKLVYADGGNALTLMFWRFIMSVVIIGALVLCKRQSFKVEKFLVRPVTLLGLIWSGSMILYLMAVESISVSVAVLILYSYPVIVLLYSMIRGLVAVSPKLIVVFIVAFTGVGLMLGGGSVSLNPYGVVFSVLAATGAAYTFLSGSRVAKQLNPVVLTFWVNFMGIFLILPLIYGRFMMPETAAGWYLTGGATICYIIAILCQFQALSHMPAAKAAFLFNFEPVVSLCLAAIILGERLAPVQWVGVAIVMVVLLRFGNMTGNSRPGKIATENDSA